MKVNLQTLQIDVTNRCNLRCRHCGRLSINQNVAEPSTIDMRRVIMEFQSVGFEHIAFSGGEPTLRRDLIKLIEYAKYCGLFTSITTNGVFNQQTARDLVNSDIDLIEFSLDGLQKTHESIRGIPNIFGTVINNITFCMKQKKKMVIKIVLQNSNIGEFENFVSFLQKRGVKDVNVRTVVPCGKKKEFFLENIFPDNVIAQLLQRASEKYKVNIYTDNPRVNLFNRAYVERLMVFGDIFGGELIAGCLAGISNFFVDNFFNVFPCSYLPQKLGNLYLTPMAEIIKRAQHTYLDLRENLKGKCRTCKYKFICGGCRAIAYSNGDVSGEDIACKIL